MVVGQGLGGVEHHGCGFGLGLGHVEGEHHEYEGFARGGQRGYHGVVAFVQEVQGDGLVIVDGWVGVDCPGSGPAQMVGDGDGTLRYWVHVSAADGGALHSDRPACRPGVEACGIAGGPHLQKLWGMGTGPYLGDSGLVCLPGEGGSLDFQGLNCVLSCVLCGVCAGSRPAGQAVEGIEQPGNLVGWPRYGVHVQVFDCTAFLSDRPVLGPGIAACVM